MKEHLNWWKNFGSYTRKVLQQRYFPATNYRFLTESMIENIYLQEKNK